MELIKFDIDQLLEATSTNNEDDHFYNMKEIEIDMILAVTKDW
ncbi:hypothetical protein [Pseudoneobacillus sp. C159]